MDKSFFTNNRKRFAELLEEPSVALFYSGSAPVKSNDQRMSPFSVNRNFYYLTGIDTENVWLLIAKNAFGITEMLFTDQPDEEIIKWTGQMLTREQASELSGIKEEQVRYTQDFERLLSRYLDTSRQDVSVWFSLDRLDLSVPATASERLAIKIRNKYPSITVKNSAPLLASLRSIKTDEEIACIRKAGDVTISALRHMLHTAKPGEYEYQWQADFEYYVARSGLRIAFSTIAASGENAVMLHYEDNNCIAKNGGMFLFDLGAEYKYYSADVSRTFPVNGRFTARQKELFSIVREAQLVAMDNMRPGNPVRDSNRAVIEFYKKALRTIKLIDCDEDVTKYYYHGVSHSLGLDTHDPCDRKIYEPGMVVTDEPGLYIAQEGIGIRLENDILVTENGPEDLTGDRLLQPDEIEQLMA